MKLNWHGHAFFELELATGARFAVDPFTQSAGNPLTSTEADDVDVDTTLVTHGHGDHFGATLDVGEPVLAIHEVANYIQNQGLEDAAGTGGGMNLGGTVEVGGADVTMVPALHSSGCPGAEGPFMGEGGDPAGFVIDDGETTFYHMGDTALFGDLKHVVGDHFDPDLVAVPIGDVFTMGPDAAATAIDWIDPDACIPIHYDTFGPIEQDPDAFAREVASADVHVVKPDSTLTY
ncbi:metal-dependent hydrolase [Thermoplasmatales archaeon SW_10_69_26]|jgi:L-ascorbate metabolism protein UlaG (beta-lactamase superfamily)|nr:MAG: metal-dependent hydrolase [Thermoplasmatales archaeon SW_10_69_26]